MSEPAPIRHGWSASDRLVPRVVVRPLQRLLAAETAGAGVSWWLAPAARPEDPAAAPTEDRVRVPAPT